MKFRVKPVPVDVGRCTGTPENREKLKTWIGDIVWCGAPRRGWIGVIHAAGATYHVRKGDYIVRYGPGDFRRLSPEQFAAEFERVD